MRPGAEDIYDRVKRDAAEEIERPALALLFSGLLAGATLGFSGLADAATVTAAGQTHAAELLGAAFYPIGFIAAIVGRAQLFTENTLYPVTLVLDDRAHLRATLRLWVIVLGANLIGALGFALMAVETNAIPGGAVRELVHIGDHLSSGSWVSTFWSGVFAGWLLALVAWLTETADHVTGQVLLIWLLTFVIGLVGFSHCVSTSAQVISACLEGTVSTGHFFAWLSAVVLGNIVGGVAIVGVFNYGQVRAPEL
jgi:formate/nitrite transporter FocA (FNT family)